MPRSARVCSYCQREMAEDEFKCKACGNLVETKTAPPERVYMQEEGTPLDRYSIVLLVIMTLVFAPIAMTIGGVLLFHEDPYRRDTGKLIVTGSVVVMAILFLVFVVGSGTLTVRF